MSRESLPIRIEHEGRLFALIIPGDFSAEGVNFFTPPDFSQQLAYMKHPKGRAILPHVHNLVLRQVQFTNEVLFIRKGKLRVDFYDEDHTYLKSRILNAGDTIFLARGGHGFEVIEDLEMIEVKQGPYNGEADKVRFSGVTADVAQIEK